MLDHRRLNLSTMPMTSKFLWVNIIVLLVLMLLLWLQILLLLVLLLLLLCLLSSLFCTCFLLDVNIVFRTRSLLLGIGYYQMRAWGVLSLWVDWSAIHVSNHTRWCVWVGTRLMNWIIVCTVWPSCAVWVLCSMLVLWSITVLSRRNYHILNVVIDRKIYGWFCNFHLLWSVQKWGFISYLRSITMMSMASMTLVWITNLRSVHILIARTMSMMSTCMRLATVSMIAWRRSCLSSRLSSFLRVCPILSRSKSSSYCTPRCSWLINSYQLIN